MASVSEANSIMLTLLLYKDLDLGCNSNHNSVDLQGKVAEDCA